MLCLPNLVGLTKSVPPNFLAHASFASFTSTTIILPALFLTAPWTTERPTQPAPKTATLDPFSTFAVTTAAPYPVVIPHPSRHVLSIGALSVIATTEMSATTVYCENVDVP